MQSLDLIVRKFLKKHDYLDKPLLLALSGGPDSMALFYLLLQIKAVFEVAHIDHRWRPTSQQEAEELRLLCQKHNKSFHLSTLQVASCLSNLEERCREERLLFFKKILQTQGLHAVLCAHHADDQAETVLKRALEGSSLSKLSALQPVKKWEDFVVLRPLLSVTKTNLLAWLEDKKISYFVDNTNNDNTFLRGRMRNELLPKLSQSFGKNVQKGLCRLAQSALEFTDYLEHIFAPLWKEIQVIEGGCYLFFPKEIVSQPFLCKMALKMFLEKQRLLITNKLLDVYVAHLQMGKTKKEVIKGRFLILDKNKVTIYSRSGFDVSHIEK